MKTEEEQAAQEERRELIRARLLRHRISVPELALLLGVTGDHLQEMLAGERGLTAHRCRAALEAIGLLARERCCATRSPPAPPRGRRRNRTMPGQLDSFRAARQRASITTLQVANQLGVAEASVIGWEDGSIPVTAAIAQRYARACKLLGAVFAGSDTN